MLGWERFRLTDAESKPLKDIQVPITVSQNSYRALFNPSKPEDRGSRGSSENPHSVFRNSPACPFRSVFPVYEV